MSTNIDYKRLLPFTDVGCTELGYQLNVFKRNRFNTGNLYEYDLMFQTLDACVNCYNNMTPKPPYATIINLDNNKCVREL